MGVALTIDRFTPCLLDRSSGELVQTTYALASPNELRGLKKQGWLFNWTGKDLRGSEIYKLTLQGSAAIQGLVALQNEPENRACHLKLAESAPQNRIGHRYEGVGGHLFAIAAQRSTEFGYDGFVYFEAKNIELVHHYAEKFGAFLIGRPHPYSMILDEEAASQLLDNYTLNGG